MNDLITAYEVAAFTSNPDAGSPTGIVLNAETLSSDQMQQIARHFPYSHTAFVTELAQPDCDIEIRFFTSAGELQNCAHATIATHVLRAELHPDLISRVIKQKTLSGIQEVDIIRDKDIQVFFRQQEIRFQNVEPEQVTLLLSALKIPESALDKRYPIIFASPGSNRFMVGVDNTEELNPDFDALRLLCEQSSAIGCFVYAVDSSNTLVTAHARMFAPAIGVNEDMINGNSSGCLGAYLLTLDKTRNDVTLTVFQGSKLNRLGTVGIEARRIDGKIETMIVGSAAIVGQIPLPTIF